jgi:hypothetical protein
LDFVPLLFVRLGSGIPPFFIRFESHPYGIVGLLVNWGFDPFIFPKTTSLVSGLISALLLFYRGTV